MPDIFISYAHSTLVEAETVAESLRALGYGVWRDDDLPPHRAYADVIADRLKEAKAVVVVWSADAVRSQWVRSEADKARADHKLVQLNIDGAPLPMPFDQIRCVDLAGWSGDPDAQGWRKVVDSVAELVGDKPAAAERPRAAAPGRRLSICVLPFANRSADAEQDYFSDGISEDIITDLSKVSALSVVARNRSFAFRGQATDARQVGRELNVGHVLDGSVRKSGDRVRISAQLINVANGAHVWAERWDRNLTNIFAVQDEISHAVVAALKLRLLPEEKKAIARRGTASSEAYDLYLMARQYRASGNEGDPRRDEAIVRFCRRATEIDPNYAQAWALMALAQSVLRFNFRKGDADGLEAAERALALDPNLAEAHAVKARHFINQNKHDEAASELEIALRLDPESWEANKNAGLLSFRRRRHEDAIRYYRKTTELAETDFSSPMMLVTCYSALGDGDAARRAARVASARAEMAVAVDRSNGAAMATGCLALAILGEADQARDWARRALLIDPHNMVMRYNLACALGAYLRDIDGAIEILKPFFAAADAFWVSHAKIDPELDPVREDPRFAAMIAATEARLAAAPDPKHTG
jgi:adenylate cyclase